MDTHNMDQTIFLTNTSTLAKSLYILVCSLMDDHVPPTLARVRGLWNGTEQDLAQAADELVKRGILAPMDLSEKSSRWWVVPSNRWFPGSQNGILMTPKGAKPGRYPVR